MFGKHILILVAHPDDEVVACAATIGRAQAEGAQILLLYLTNGCIARETLWPWQRRSYEIAINRRALEAKAVAKLLKLKPLDMPSRPARHLWRDLSNVFKEVRIAVAENGIDQIWVPAYEGGNADHDALNAIGQLFKDEMTVLEFAEYNFFKSKNQPQTFPNPNGTEHAIFLTKEEQERKRSALALYQSEKKNLNYIGTDKECYRPLAPYNYKYPPHHGILWYTRFQWVPFRHPRVDFTKPSEVSIAIEHFFQSIKTKI